MSQLPAIVVFCHLRWNFVYQRPQHLLSRLAQGRRVLFIEEPIFTEGPAYWEKSESARVRICRPHTSVAVPGFSDEQGSVLKLMVAQLLKEEGIADYLLWFYTPLALPLAEELQPQAVVYDCMDELSAFRHAPPQLREREKALMRKAEVVFTGGPSLYRAKKDLHPNVHCFSSSVDAPHFAKGRNGDDHPEQAGLARPRFGFFGVIDERFDVPLLAHLADSRPDWQFSIVGPVVKIDPNTLPRNANIYYFGQRSYEELPRFLAGWDVALLPFARNESTRFISPTKTLEYMAAEKPIVSTPITDVVEPYGEIAYFGNTPEEFLAACERAFTATESERAERTEKMRKVILQTSWDHTVKAMSHLIEQAVAVHSHDEYAPPERTPAYDAGHPDRRAVPTQRGSGRQAVAR